MTSISTTRVTLIWWLIPESLEIYDLEVDKETLDNLRRCHNRFINCENFPDDLTNWLSEFVDGVKENGIFSDQQISRPILHLTASELIVTGFGL